MNRLSLKMVAMVLAGLFLISCESSKSTVVSPPDAPEDTSFEDGDPTQPYDTADDLETSSVDSDIDANPDTEQLPDRSSEDTGFETDSTSRSETMDECATVTDKAELIPRPVDIVIAVDNSGSMREEAGWVQENLNAFSNQIAASGVDYHIALISASNDVDEGICVDPPLGSGSCPDDSQPPRFLHVLETVSSTDALELIDATFEEWKTILRPDSMRHFLVVSDDNARDNADDFSSWMSTRGISEFTFHAIVASAGSEITWSCLTGGAHACCADTFPHSPLGSQRGEVYIELADETGGVFGDLCEQDFEPVFDELATTIGEISIACQWEIPAPPSGETFDPAKVNVELNDGAGKEHVVGYVETPAQCSDVQHGWYYDNPDNPTQIFVCEQTCSWLQGFEDGVVEIILGCETKPAVVV